MFIRKATFDKLKKENFRLRDENIKLNAEIDNAFRRRKACKVCKHGYTTYINTERFCGTVWQCALETKNTCPDFEQNKQEKEKQL